MIERIEASVSSSWFRLESVMLTVEDGGLAKVVKGAATKIPV